MAVRLVGARLERKRAAGRQSKHKRSNDIKGAELSGTEAKRAYTYAEALRRLIVLGAVPDPFKPEAGATPCQEEEINDWLFAREIPELAAWFGSEA